jgi:hypothetical protein
MAQNYRPFSAAQICIFRNAIRTTKLPFIYTLGTTILTPRIRQMKKLAAFTALALSFAATGAFAENLTGYVSDAMCSKDTHMVSSADHAACAQKCIKGGDKPVLVVDDKTVYTITNPSILVPHAGEKVTVEGSVKGSAVTVTKVTKL